MPAHTSTGRRAVDSYPGRRLGFFRYAFLFLTVGGAVAFIFFHTLGSSYAYDDMDYLNGAADVLAGKRSYLGLIFQPHLEHLVPVLRTAFLASAAFFGWNATPFRVVVLVAHVLAAFFLALVVRRSGSDAASLIAALGYVIPCGFSSMWLWLMTGAGVPFGLVGLTSALAAIVWQRTIGVTRARWLAIVGVAMMLLSESTLAPLAVVPALLDEQERDRRAGRFGWFAWTCLGLMLAWMAVAAVVYNVRTGARLSLDFGAGTKRAVWLLLVAPIRLLCPRLSLAGRERIAPFGGMMIFGLLVLTAVRLCSSKRCAWLFRTAALTAIGPVAYLELVGLGRSRFSYLELYDADRYFFPLLIPLSIFVGGIALAISEYLATWPRNRRLMLGGALLVLSAILVSTHRKALADRFPREAFEIHEHRFREVSRLAGLVAKVGESLAPGDAPLMFPDTSLFFPDVHNGRISARFLLFVAHRGDMPGVRLGGKVVGQRDETLLNRVLKQWAAAVGEPLPFIEIRQGELFNARETSDVDFRGQPSSPSIVSGFYQWEGASRWMSNRGILRLKLASQHFSLLGAAPVIAIRRTYPKWHDLDVRIGLLSEDQQQRWDVPGTIRFSEDRLVTRGVEIPQEIFERLRNRWILVVLECDQVWTPRTALPGSMDGRELTVQVFRAGFAPPTTW